VQASDTVALPVQAQIKNFGIMEAGQPAEPSTSSAPPATASEIARWPSSLIGPSPRASGRFQPGYPLVAQPMLAFLMR
jgi:hypothetical protein